MLILGNGRMITRDADNPYLECGAVVIDGTKIVKAGTLSEVKAAYPDAEFLDAKGKVIMPAFINAHEHIYSAFARGLSVKGYDPKGFLDILDGMWWTIDRNLTLHDTYLSAMATYIDSIKNGWPTVFAHLETFVPIRVLYMRLKGLRKKPESAPVYAMRSRIVTGRIRQEIPLWKMQSLSVMHKKRIPA